MRKPKRQTDRAARPTRAGAMAARGHAGTHPTQAEFKATAPLTADQQAPTGRAVCEFALSFEDAKYLGWILSCHIEGIERDPQMKIPACRHELLESIADVERLQGLIYQAMYSDAGGRHE